MCQESMSRLDGHDQVKVSLWGQVEVIGRVLWVVGDDAT